MVGIVHTNYLEYIKREKNGALQAFFVKHINNMVVRAYCHKVVVRPFLFLIGRVIPLEFHHPVYHFV